MPVKIQELVIQTKVRSNNSSMNDSNKPISSQELRKFENRLRHVCIEAMENLLQQKQER
jgi:hypothetical protein